MRIFHIITGLSTGGAEKALFNLLKGGLIYKFDNYVISLCDEGNVGPSIKELGVPVITLNINKQPGGTIAGMLKLKRFIHEYEPDILQGWMYHGNLACLLGKCMARSKAHIFWSIRQTLYNIKYEKRITQLVIMANKLLSKHPEAILYNSDLSLKQHIKYGFQNKLSLVIPNGIDTDYYHFDSSIGRKMRQELSIKEDSLVVLHAARYHPMKDHACFIESSVRVASRLSDVCFVLAGRDVQPSNEKLASLIPYKMKDRFFLLGERRDILELMCMSDIFCLSSAWGEAFPNVIGEAMATGIPCITTDVGDCRKIIGQSGAIVTPGDIEALSEAMLNFLLMPSAKRKELGKAAQSRIAKRYDLHMIVKKYISIYEGSAMGS